MECKKELIKEYLKSIKFSTNSAYVNLICGFSKYENNLKKTNKRG